MENKLRKTQATLLTFNILIPGDTTFTIFSQVSSSMYADLLEITQDPSVNLYLVTRLVSMSLGCIFPPFAINITVPLNPAAVPTQRTVIENLESLQFFS